MEQVLFKFYNRRSLRSATLIAFTIITILSFGIISIIYTLRYIGELETVEMESNTHSLKQVESHFSQRLQNVIDTFDVLYFNLMNEGTVSESDVSLLQLTSNKVIQNITLFDNRGKIITTAPALKLNSNVHVTAQGWYKNALVEYENKQFSRPHIQNIFVNSNSDMEWVVSITQSVICNVDGQEIRGVLLIDVKYSAIIDFIDGIEFHENGYTYITDGDGELIYHPSIQLIQSGVVDSLERESHYESVDRRMPYTGWNIVGVVEEKPQDIESVKELLFLMWLFFLFFAVIMILNIILSNAITKPIQELEKSVGVIASGNLDAKIPRRGFLEIWGLSDGIRKMTLQIRKLLEDATKKQEKMRKHELEVLQSQIHPHFLYNTLDTIVWMIEKGEMQNASKAVTALGRFFRISLSKGKDIISVKNELSHVSNYLDIQMFRYKNKFEYTIDVAETLYEYQMIKLILQPIVENALYHAMEFMDGEGLISITADEQEDAIIFCIEDNGQGIDEKTIERLESGLVSASEKGSGIGVSNVIQRIKICYGMQYGIKYESELDEGTKVFITIPKVKEGEDAKNLY